MTSEWMRRGASESIYHPLITCLRLAWRTWPQSVTESTVSPNAMPRSRPILAALLTLLPLPLPAAPEPGGGDGGDGSVAVSGSDSGGDALKKFSVAPGLQVDLWAS